MILYIFSVCNKPVIKKMAYCVTLLCLVSILVVCATDDSKNKEMEAAFRDFLKIKVGKNDVTPQEPPPAYMLDLYRKYTNNPSSTHSLANTVRSITPTIGRFEGKEMLVFNLTGVGIYENILYSELHIFKRKRGTRNLRAMRVQVFDVTQESVPLLMTLDFSKTWFGWRSFDVSGPVQICRSRHTRFHLLGIMFQMEKRRKTGKFRVVTLKKVVKPRTQPFLIVFSDDNETRTVGSDLEKHLKGVYLDNNSQNNTIRHRRSLHDNKIDEVDFSVSTSTSVLDESQALMDNEIPEQYNDYDVYPSVFKAIYSKEKKKPKMDPNILPYPNDLVPRKNKSRKTNKKSRKNRRLPQAWQTRHEMHENSADLSVPLGKGARCQRQKLVVDFSEIGWGQWIISPKTFQAHYCAGTCPFPLNKRLRPSNHAMIQSIVHALSVDPHVPAPSCVPDTMSSVTLLYFEEGLNVVLKNYPSMTVQSCACR